MSTGKCFRFKKINLKKVCIILFCNDVFDWSIHKNAAGCYKDLENVKKYALDTVKTLDKSTCVQKQRIMFNVVILVRARK